MLSGRLLSYLKKKKKIAEVVTRCHSYHSWSFVVTRCYSLYHSLSIVVPLAVIRCHSLHHSLSLDGPLVCIFINDLPFKDESNELKTTAVNIATSNVYSISDVSTIENFSSFNKLDLFL